MVTSLLMIGNETVWNGGADVETGRAATAAEGLASLSRRAWDVVLVGRVSDSTPESLLAQLSRRYPAIPVIVVDAVANEEVRRQSWEVVASGASVREVVARAAEISRLRREVARLGEVNEVVVTTPAVTRAFEQGSVREMERLMIEARLARLNQNRTHAAASLEISVRTLRNKLREYRESPRSTTPVEPR
jgi:DNA-binding NtrC family response regulator